VRTNNPKDPQNLDVWPERALNLWSIVQLSNTKQREVLACSLLGNAKLTVTAWSINHLMINNTFHGTNTLAGGT
jgi:hypothetical protein